MNQLKFNTNLLPLKTFYLLWNGGAFTMLSFTPVLAKQLGYSSFILGIICAVLPLSGMFAKPLMGMIADKFKCQKIIFLISQLVTIIAFMCMIFLPKISTPTKIRLSCDSSGIVVENFEDDFCQVQHHKNGFPDNETICNFTCPLEPQHWETICDHWWKVDKYCLTHPETLSLTANVTQNLCCTYVTFEDGGTNYTNCPSPYKISTDCNVYCDKTNDFFEKYISNDDHVVDHYAFWLFLFAYLLAWTSQAVTGSIGDAVCFQILDDKPYNYGYQRMWGALGCGIFSIACGILVDTFSESETEKNYGPVYVTGSIILGVSVIVCSRIQYTQQKISTSILKDIGRLLSKIRIWIFMICCMCVGICTALTWYFLFWHLEDLAADYGHDMQSNMKTIEGLILGIQCIGGDLPFLFLSGWIFKRIGHIHTMSFILIVIATKFLLYSFLINPWWCLPIEFLNGPTYGLFYATMTSYASIIAPPGTEATTQGLFGAIFEGIGLAMGSLMGGLFFNEFGGWKTFRIFSISAFVVCLLHVGVQYLIRCMKIRDKGITISE